MYCFQAKASERWPPLPKRQPEKTASALGRGKLAELHRPTRLSLPELVAEDST